MHACARAHTLTQELESKSQQIVDKRKLLQLEELRRRAEADKVRQAEREAVRSASRADADPVTDWVPHTLTGRWLTRWPRLTGG